MKELKALITARFTDEGISKLKKYMDVEYKSWIDIKRPFTQQEMETMLNDKDILIMEMGELKKEVLDKAKNLKLIACCRGLRGDDMTIDISECSRRNIPILLAPGRNLNSVAEFTILLTLGIMKKLIPGIKWFYDGGWNEWLDFHTNFMTEELKGKQVGLIGFGNIGKRVSKLFNAFDANVVAYDPFVDDYEIYKHLNVKKIGLEDLLKTSDVVSLHMNVSEDTIGLIGEREISMMKPTAYIINTARAAVIDHDALYNALKNKKIAGAAMDVYHEEPTNPEKEPLLKLNNILATPHFAGTTYEVIENHTNIVVQDIISILNNEDPKFIINPEVMKKFKNYSQIIYK